MKKLFQFALPILTVVLISFSCGDRVRHHDKGEAYYDKATDILYDTKSGKPLTGKYVSLGPNGEETIWEYKDGKAHGKMKSSHPNGYYYTQHFFNNNEAGPRKYYNPTGSEISKDEFREQTGWFPDFLK